ncbi:MAG TPA: hypothetical protein VH540_24810 [Ktedonobacterales bacterium]|jgi:hypothetical protein
MAEPSIRLTRAQAIRIVRQAAYRVPRDIQHPWACTLCGMPSREVVDCAHTADCPIGAIRAQLSEEEYRCE